MTQTAAAPSRSTPPPDAPSLPVLAVDLRTTPQAVGCLPGIARALEGAAIGAITVSGDAERGELHPIHVAAALAPHTRALALIPHTDAIDVEPFHLATQLMSLDHITDGRAGWLVQARADAAAAAAVGREPLRGEALSREAAEVIAACRLVWDSWADDAVVRDAARGKYLDAGRLQYADYEGSTFSVRGPSITPRSPQGQVPVLVADQDAQAVGSGTIETAADGRVLDVRVPTGPTTSTRDIEAHLREALPTPGADAPAPRMVRLQGLDLLAARAHPAEVSERVGRVAARLREEGLLAPAPASGASLRRQLGLGRPEARIDPARRADRARSA